MTPDWFQLDDPESIPSPALLVYPDRVAANIDRMIRIAGSATRLRPHVKTNKMPEVVRLMLDQGITRFKCATIAEAEMCARTQAPDVLLAMQPVGPAFARLAQLHTTFPKTRFSVVADDPEIVRRLNQTAAQSDLTFTVLVDLDCGQHRTGIAPDPRAFDLYRNIHDAPRLNPGGLHAYDGHLHDPDTNTRARRCDEAFQSVAALLDQLRAAGLPVPEVVAGGTPTFPFHARRPGMVCSPGTCVLWDAGYSSKMSDLDFLHAALVLTRVVSKPVPGQLCLDLGHKAVASENPPPRVVFPQLPDARHVSHSEEHLVLATDHAEAFPVGSVLYGIPWHICPTVALHSEAWVVQNRRATETWNIPARARRLAI